MIVGSVKTGKKSVKSNL